MAKKTRVLITGGAGFLGGFLTQELSHKHSVTVMDDLSTGSRNNLAGISCGFCKLRAWEKPAINLLKRGAFDLVIHLAANAYIKNSVDEPYQDFDNNLVQPLRLLDAVRQMTKKPKLLFISSAAVHGETIRFPMREDDKLRPVSPYGAGKLGLENYASVFCRTFGVPTLIVRLYPMYGPRQKKQVVFDLMRKLTLPGKILEVFGTGNEARDFLFVEDAARGMATIAGKLPFDGRTINLCSGKGIPIRQVVKTTMKTLGIIKNVHYTGKMRQGDVDKMVGSVEWLKRTVFKPEVSFEEGIKQTVLWFKETQLS